MGFGVIVVGAATRDDIVGQPNFYLFRQLTYGLAGIVAIFLAMAIDLHRVARYAWVLFGALCGAVVAVLAIGSSVRGSTRWIDLGVFQLQPSEIGKVAMILVLSAVAVERSAQVGTWRFTLLMVGVTAPPAGIVFAQPDLGTALVYFAILGAVLFLTCVPWSHLVTIGATIFAVALGILVVLPSVGVQVLKPYQYERLVAFTNASDNRSDSGYQLYESQTAIGSGGAIGRGIDGANQTRGFLPERQTDFVFASASEMFGFVGASLLILAYGVILWRGLRIISRAPSRLEQLVGVGIVTMFGFQVMVNIGMTMGIMPITGIPLPLMSYGGSQTLTSMIAVGILLGIGQTRGTPAAGARRWR
ncbi:MAG: rod shape-determining protein RodA [Actinobacteria bacterium]|nr:rod shape-determining protein RodA [Actinomycetota bacterium]